MKKMLIVSLILLLAALLAFGVGCKKSSDQGKNAGTQKGDPELAKLKKQRIGAVRFLNKQIVPFTRLTKRLENGHKKFDRITGSMNQDNLTPEDFEVVQKHRQQVQTQKQELKKAVDLLAKFKESRKRHQEMLKKDAKATAEQKKQTFTAIVQELETMKKDLVDTKKKLSDANVELKKMLSRYADAEEEKKEPVKPKITGLDPKNAQISPVSKDMFEMKQGKKTAQ